MDTPIKESQIRISEKILNCNRNDSMDIIRKKYRNLAKKCHTDKIGENNEIYIVTGAYTLLQRYKDGGTIIYDDNDNFGFNENDALAKDFQDFVNDLGIKKENIQQANEGLKEVVSSFFDIFREEMASPFLNRFLFKDRKNIEQKKEAKETINNLFEKTKEKITTESREAMLNYINKVFDWNFKIEDFKKSKVKKDKPKTKVKPKPKTTTTKSSSLQYKTATTTPKNIVDLTNKEKGNYFCWIESEETGIRINKLIYLFLLDKKIENNRIILICRDKSDIIYKLSTG